MDSIRRSVSSRLIPGTSLGSSFGEFGGRLGFDSFPDFVALNLGSIGKPLALDVHQHGSGALHVIDAEGDAVIPTEVEFCSIALQVLFADAVERAVEAAFEDSEGRLHGVGRHVTARVLLERVIHDFMRTEVRADLLVDFTLGKWNERFSPLRSTSVTTFILWWKLRAPLACLPTLPQ